MGQSTLGRPGILAPLLLALAVGCLGGNRESEDSGMAADTVSYLALGDSYTIGESVSPDLRWPVQLAVLLREGGVPVLPPVIVAQTGWTTDELASGIRDSGPRGPFDLVSLLIGVNNQYRGRALEEYRVQFLGLLSQAIGFAGGDPGRVLVVSIPDWGVTPFAAGKDREAIAREIDAFNHVNRVESERAGVGYLDVTGISREAAADPALVAEDGLHPSGAMYARWAESALPLVLEVLRDGEGPGGEP